MKKSKDNELDSVEKSTNSSYLKVTSSAEKMVVSAGNQIKQQHLSEEMLNSENDYGEKESGSSDSCIPSSMRKMVDSSGYEKEQHLSEKSQDNEYDSAEKSSSSLCLNILHHQ